MAQRPSKAQCRREFSDRLNQALDRLGLPAKGQGRQTQAARLFGVSQKGVRRWLESEGLPAQSDWSRIADAVHVSVQWLFFGLGPMMVSGTKTLTRPTQQTDAMELVIFAVDQVAQQFPQIVPIRAHLITALYRALQKRRT